MYKIINKITQRPFKKQNLGLSLTEVLVVLAIIILLIALILSNYRSGEAKNRLRESAYGLASNLRKMQNWAQTGQTIQDPIDNNYIMPQRGYGMYFTYDFDEPQNNTNYILFGNTEDADLQYYYYESDHDIVIQNITFSKDVYINNFQIGGGPCFALSSQVNIVFNPLSKDQFISQAENYPNVVNEGEGITIELGLKNQDVKACVSVTTQGKIEITLLTERNCF